MRTKHKLLALSSASPPLAYSLPNGLRAFVRLRLACSLEFSGNSSGIVLLLHGGHLRSARWALPVELVGGLLKGGLSGIGGWSFEGWLPPGNLPCSDSHLTKHGQAQHVTGELGSMFMFIEGGISLVHAHIHGAREPLRDHIGYNTRSAGRLLPLQHDGQGSDTM